MINIIDIFRGCLFYTGTKFFQDLNGVLWFQLIATCYSAGPRIYEVFIMYIPLASHIAGFVANISSNVAFLPQIIRSFKRKKVEDVSIGMFTVLFLTQICWIIYAVPIGAKNLWISSVIEIALLLPLFVMFFWYKEFGGSTVKMIFWNLIMGRNKMVTEK